VTVTLDKLTHTYTTDGGVVLSSVSRILEATGVREPYYGPAIYAARGRYVHEASELLDKHDLAWDLVEPEWVGCVRAYESFLAENEVEWEATEEIVFRPGVYAGTLDRRGRVNGHRVIVDLKTGSPARWHRIQLGAYNVTFQQSRRYGLRALYLGKDGRYKMAALSPTEAEQAGAVWEATLTVYLWKEERL